MAWTCKPSGEICKSVEFWTGLFLSIFGKELQGKELHGKEWYQRIKSCWLGMEWNGLGSSLLCAWNIIAACHIT
jgi:hypothetical protein